jgi:hypothetical protein
MSRLPYQEIVPAEYLGGLRTTLREKVFCSANWQEACCQEIETASGQRIRVDMQIYPPGGKRRTAMRRCSICRKWAPPDGATAVCSDCRTEADVEAFDQRLQRLKEHGNEGLEEILRRVHWRRLRVRTRNPKEAKKGPDPLAFLSDDLQEEQDDSLSLTEITVPVHAQTTSGQHWLAETLDLSEPVVGKRSSGAVASALREHLLWVARDTKHRAAGSQAVLLPEDEHDLLVEIAYYETEDVLMPRAKQQDTVSPRRRYPPVEARAAAGSS